MNKLVAAQIKAQVRVIISVPDTTVDQIQIQSVGMASSKIIKQVLVFKHP